MAMLLLLALVQLFTWLVPMPDELRGTSAYLPLHTLLEMVAIVIAMMVFAVGWNSQDSNLSGNLVLLACIFFAVGWLDFSHALSYEGMPDFVTSSNAEKAINFWLAARFMAALALLGIAVRSWRPIGSAMMRYLLMGAGIVVVLFVNWLVLFHSEAIPHTFVPGQGLTPLKLTLEHLLIALNAITALLLLNKMRTPQPFNVALLFGAVCVMAMSELFFTMYADVTDIFNLLGHIYKVIAYLLIYRAIVVESIEAPYQKLDKARQNLALAVKASNIGLWNRDISSNEVNYSPEWKAQLGYQPDELLNHFSTFESLLHPEDKVKALDQLQHVMDSSEKNYENEFRLCHRDGSYRWILARGEKQFDAYGTVTHLIGSHIDITERKRAEARIEHLAHFDRLTGLPNRIMLDNQFKLVLGMAQRNDESFAVLFLDLDHFKNINDTLGHSIGDQLLMEMARRLKVSIRKQDMVSRLGGDEFILILTDVDAEHAAIVVTKLIEAASKAYQYNQHELVITPSIGIAIYPDDGASLDVLSKNADAAMYRAKSEGRNCFRFFTPEMQEHSARTLQLSNALRHALVRNELLLYYQPQVDMEDEHVIGVEALLRWQHPERGMVSPAEFIPIAENGGQIIEIGEWVLRTACTQLKSWMDSGMPPMMMAVNLSAVQFKQENITNLIVDILDDVGLSHEYLEVELTETASMANPEVAIEVMNRLDAKGIRMSIDDFGTGYSSLSYLKKFRVYKLKIDQSFVLDITDDLDDEPIVTAIISMAHSLGMQTIAEGVETVEQLELLRLHGCDEVQGYYFSRPLPADQLELFLKNR